MRTSSTGLSSTSGVLPTSSRRLPATRVSATGHRRQENHGRPGTDFSLEAFERTHVLAFHVHVDERRELLVLDELLSQGGEPAHQVVEEVANRLAFRGDLACASCLLTQRRWNADVRHAGSLVPAQNST